MRCALLLASGFACTDASAPASVTVTGSVRPPAAVDVVFRSATREDVAKASADGKYRIVLRPGSYRVAVRDDAWMTVGRGDRVRLPGLPGAVAAGAPDEALMPRLDVMHDAEDVDITIVRSGIVTGTVFDIDAHPVVGAVISAHGNTPDPTRPALGSDVAVSRYDGSFELRLPDGDYRLAASHVAYADSIDVGAVDVKGGTRHVSLTLVKGCIVTGKILAADGKSAGEGAIEKRFGPTDLEFVPNGRSDSDGKFRWTTTDEREVVLRAWPWHQPPSPSKRFACRDGARFTTTFRLPARSPEMSGVLVDRSGAPVPFAHLDVQPLDPGGLAQQERTDVHGRWAVYQMPPGRYAVSAQAPGGVISTIVTSPSANTKLELSGTGRIEGTTQLANGSFELSLGACLDRNLTLPRDTRIVPVRNGRFVVDGVPACELQFTAEWRSEAITARTTVPGRVQLDIGPPREKLVHGTVRDGDKPVAGAHVTATYKKRTSTAITDEAGRYTIETFAGATITVGRAIASVGLANVPRERVDVALSRR